MEIGYKDLADKLSIEVVQDGEPSEAYLQETASEVQQYIKDRLFIGAVGGQPYELHYNDSTLFAPEGGWAQYNFTIKSGPIPDELEITHNIGYEDDRGHRGVLVIEKGEWPAEGYEMQVVMVFRSSNTTQVLDRNHLPTLLTPVAMIWEGMIHIWIGLDHILFLIALTLPIVFIKVEGRFVPTERFGSSFGKLLKVVTIFTVAHSITLLLAGLEVVSLSSRLVESIIALSIVIVAVNNIRGGGHAASFIVIFFLGLFHGLGFASVMGDLPLWTEGSQKVLMLSVLGFNFGVELGQVAILLLLFPVLHALRRNAIYKPLILKGGSVILALIAGYWFIERAFDL
ncbi:MAG: HupE/UreJ family protein [Opitutaceae bacterium]